MSGLRHLPDKENGSKYRLAADQRYISIISQITSAQTWNIFSGSIFKALLMPSSWNGTFSVPFQLYEFIPAKSLHKFYIQQSRHPHIRISNFPGSVLLMLYEGMQVSPRSIFSLLSSSIRRRSAGVSSVPLLTKSQHQCFFDQALKLTHF